MVGVGGGSVDDGPRGQDDGQRLQRSVGVVDGAAGHAAGVVGQDTAERAGALAGRVGPEFEAVGSESGVHLTDGDAGLDPDAGAVVEDVDAAEVTAGVGQQPVGDCLSGQGCAAGTERHRYPRLRGSGEQAAHVGGRAGGDDGRRNEQEVGGVVGQGEPVHGPVAHCPGIRGAQHVQQPGRRRRQGEAVTGHGGPVVTGQKISPFRTGPGRGAADDVGRRWVVDYRAAVASTVGMGQGMRGSTGIVGPWPLRRPRWVDGS